MNSMPDDAVKLREGEAAMEAAGFAAMQQKLPRDLDRPWRSVAMRYDLDFFNRHHAALRAAFDRGIAAGLGSAP